LGRMTMKDAANCDNLCELQNFVTHQDSERKLRPGVESGHVCSSAFLGLESDKTTR